MAAPIVNGRINEVQLRAMKDALRNANLTKAKRQRLLLRIAQRGIIPASKRNAKNQQTPDGQAWPGRKHGKRKMLTKLPKFLKAREMAGGQVRIYLQGGNYRNGTRRVAAGSIGGIHQAGATIQSGAANYRNQPSQEGKMATKRQAKKLRDLGYRVMFNDRWVKPAIAYITAEMTMTRAGAIIRSMSNTPVKRTWSIVLPSRAFLGVSDEEFNKILARQLQGIGFGAG